VLAGTTTLAHLAALPVIIDREDLVLIDAFAHASMHAVMPSLQSKGAKVRRVRHNDLERVAEHAATAAPRRVWYVVDGVYSMHGDIAPVAELRYREQ
jgi:7-keto-8-aminopelargonate synthetase-like enzyme